MKRAISNNQKGFTLLEVIVAVGVFSIIALIATATLLSTIAANNKLRAQQLVVQNLNFAIDSMVREMRTGTTYHCGGGSYDVAASCTGGNDIVAFESSGGDQDSVADQVVYRLNGDVLERSVNGGSSFAAVTSGNISIDNLEFRVYGAEASDNDQPRILIVIQGTAGAGRSLTEFSVQTQATQRILDS